MTQTDIEFLIKVVGGITALTLFIVGFIRYRNDQIWKRKEFVSKEVKEFINDHTIHNCLLMLDWDTRNIELYPKHPDFSKRFVVIGRKEMISALMVHGRLKSRFTPDEAVIRDSFDYFLDRISGFEHFIQTGLLKASDLEPYLRYWINTIAEELPEPFRSTLHHYIIGYGFNDVISFFHRFGKEIKPRMPLEQIIAEYQTSG
jgi:hypothetical protein